jgi:hypothetical protein
MRATVYIITAVVITGCGGGNTGPKVESTGAERSAKTTALETGAAAMQQRAPIGSINVYLDGFHFYNGDLRRQMEAHHYCANVNEDLIQCVMFDGNTDARGEVRAVNRTRHSGAGRTGIDAEARRYI